MKVLVIGSGGREHAIVSKLKEAKSVSEVFCYPGNPGIEQEATIPAVNNYLELINFAKQNSIALTVIGPEAPIAEGIGDLFRENNLKVFSPTKQASQLEGSKGFSKKVMLEAGVKTAKGDTFHSFDKAHSFLKSLGDYSVIKADGLAAGKGVVVASTFKEAETALYEFMVEKKFGTASEQVVIEERLPGKEASIICLVNGDLVVPLPISQDYKRIFAGDKGPNTGGMGAISPTPTLSESEIQIQINSIFLPVVKQLKKQNIDYQGFLYAGVMVSKEQGVNVLEFNCRLGDPETEAILLRAECDLAETILKLLSGEMPEISFSKEPAQCVVLASEGYPEAPIINREISGLEKIEKNIKIFHAGTKKSPEGKIITAGGRVLVLANKGPDCKKKLNEAIKKVSFTGMQFRADIGE